MDTRRFLMNDAPVCNTVCLAVRHSLLANRFLVRLDVKLDEQEQVARKERASEHRSLLCSGTAAQRREVGEVVGGIVGVGYVSHRQQGQMRHRRTLDVLAK